MNEQYDTSRRLCTSLLLIVTSSDVRWILFSFFRSSACKPEKQVKLSSAPTLPFEATLYRWNQRQICTGNLPDYQFSWSVITCDVLVWCQYHMAHAMWLLPRHLICTGRWVGLSSFPREFYTFHDFFHAGFKAWKVTKCFCIWTQQFLHRI